MRRQPSLTGRPWQPSRNPGERNFAWWFNHVNGILEAKRMGGSFERVYGDAVNEVRRSPHLSKDEKVVLLALLEASNEATETE